MSYAYTPISSQNLGFIVYIFLFALIIAFRMKRGLYGRKYKHWRTYFLPAIYMIFTFSIILFDWKVFGIYIDVSLLLLIVIGVMIGFRFGKSVSFFNKDGILYYKRSPFILLFWLFSFLGRISIELALPQNVLYAEILDGLLAITSGLLIGEAFHITKKRDEFLKNYKMLSNLSNMQSGDSSTTPSRYK